MATLAEYLTIIGDERIVSFKNSIGDDIPKTLEATLGYNVPSHPPKGNRKVVIKVLTPVAEGAVPAVDQTLNLIVHVPAGVIKDVIQSFDANTPQMDYYPSVIVSPYNLYAYEAQVNADPGNQSVANQTVTVTIRLPGAVVNGDPAFLVEIDWSHTSIN